MLSSTFGALESRVLEKKLFESAKIERVKTLYREQIVHPATARLDLLSTEHRFNLPKRPSLFTKVALFCQVPAAEPFLNVLFIVDNSFSIQRRVV
jgi:hypothetical protein